MAWIPGGSSRYSSRYSTRPAGPLSWNKWNTAECVLLKAWGTCTVYRVKVNGSNVEKVWLHGMVLDKPNWRLSESIHRSWWGRYSNACWINLINMLGFNCCTDWTEKCQGSTQTANSPHYIQIWTAWLKKMRWKKYLDLHLKWASNGYQCILFMNAIKKSILDAKIRTQRPWVARWDRISVKAQYFRHVPYQLCVFASNNTETKSGAALRNLYHSLLPWYYGARSRVCKQGRIMETRKKVSEW